MASRGVDPLRLHTDQFLNAVYWFVVREADPKEVKKFDARLWVPPVGTVPTRGPWTAEAETAAFQAVKAQMGRTGSQA